MKDFVRNSPATILVLVQGQFCVRNRGQRGALQGTFPILSFISSKGMELLFIRVLSLIRVAHYLIGETGTCPISWHEATRFSV
jgi:hypothetical protein